MLTVASFEFDPIDRFRFRDAGQGLAESKVLALFRSDEPERATEVDLKALDRLTDACCQPTWAGSTSTYDCWSGIWTTTTSGMVMAAVVKL